MLRFAVSLLVLGLSATIWASASFAQSSSTKETAADRMMPRYESRPADLARGAASSRGTAIYLTESSPCSSVGSGDVLGSGVGGKDVAAACGELVESVEVVEAVEVANSASGGCVLGRGGAATLQISELR
jgi:hypothetical protein